MKSKGLEHLGFVPDIDFKLQDDGNGPYLKEWHSQEPRPTQADVDAASVAWQEVYDSEQADRESKRSSAKTKLENLGLTTEEIKEAFGI